MEPWKFPKRFQGSCITTKHLYDGLFLYCLYRFLFLAISMLISLILFAATNEWTTPENQYSYSWSFILGWIGVLLSLLAALWGLVYKQLINKQPDPA